MTVVPVVEHNGYLPSPGDSIAPGELSVSKAFEFVRVLQSGALPYVRLVECRRTEQGDVVIYDAEPEIPQARVADIRHVERIAVTFYSDDEWLPETISLRPDFPLVPHLNLREKEFPRSLCLWEEPYRDLKLRWTAFGYAKRILSWLAKSARGELHEADQPLEQFLLAGVPKLVYPHDLLEGDANQLPRLTASSIQTSPGGFTVIAERQLTQDKNFGFIAILVGVPPQTHGPIRRSPETLADLHDFLVPAGYDLRENLTRELRNFSGDEQALAARLILLIVLPKRRTDESPVEAHETWAFATHTRIAEVGRDIGIWDLHEGRVGLLLGRDASRTGFAVKLLMLDPIASLSRGVAAALNNTVPVEASIVALGAGALGSQIIINLVRSGFGNWAIVDEDVLLPHNVARHALPKDAVGFGKAGAVASIANGIIDGVDLAQGIFADATDTRNEQLATVLSQAQLIADFSASVVVARHLAIDRGSTARRMSLFLNPSGTDMVLLIEDAERAITLDQLEMQYYREIIEREELKDHLMFLGQRLRYARSCRDVTVTLPQDAVATLSGIGARAIRSAFASPDAKVIIWRTDSELNVSSARVEPAGVVRWEIGEWSVVTDKWLLGRLRETRADRLPSETGGVLLGAYDLQRRIVYVVDTIASPEDSSEWPTHYIRGVAGLEKAVQDVSDRTAGWIQYIGEWHSHPDGYPAIPSADDCVVFGWITCLLEMDGLPGFMMIVGEGEELGVHLGQIART